MTTRQLVVECARQLEQGTLPQKIFNDEAIYREELRRIFDRVWVFVAHESEIPQPGDFVTRRIGENPLLVTRDEAGAVHVLFNACRHRGMVVTRAECGHQSRFQCPYHGFVYDSTGALVGVPADGRAYGDLLDRSKWGLIPVPRVGTYAGLIFASLSDEGPTLDEFLGDIRWYLDLMFRRSDGGVAVRGVPQRWVVDGNWKLGSENFVGDAYHTLMTHRYAIQMGVAPRDPMFASYGHHVHTQHGHGLGVIGAPPGIPLPPYLALPAEVVAQAERNLSSEQLAVLRDHNFIHGTVFPNLSFLNVILAMDPEQPPAPFLTLRQWQPLGPGKMEVWSWFLVEKSAPEAYKEASYRTYVQSFGPSGTFEADDAEMWVGITRSSGGVMAERNQLNYIMGIRGLDPDPSWPGPGVAYPNDYSEANQRNFYQEWAAWMQQE